MSYIWPMALVVTSNIVYQICAKSVPEEINPFASLIVTYLMGAAACAVLYFALGSDGDLLKECGKLNWSSFINLKAEIADYLGYYDTSSFRHAFRNYYGKTPQLFRLDR